MYLYNWSEFSKNLGDRTKLPYRILETNISNCDVRCMEFWKDYGIRFMGAFKQSEYDLGSSELRSWAERSDIPSYAITSNMYPKHNASEDDYGRTSIFSACIRASEASLKKFNFAEYPKGKKPRRCGNKELLLNVI